MMLRELLDGYESGVVPELPRRGRWPATQELAFLRREFGDAPLRDLSGERIEAVLVRAVPGFRRRLLVRLHRVFDFAVGCRFIEHSPTSEIPVPPLRQSVRFRILDEREVRSLLRALTCCSHPAELLARLVLLTGLAPRDIVSLMESSVGDRELLVPNRGWVPVDDEASEILQRQAAATGKGGRLFSWKYRTSLEHALPMASEKAGLGRVVVTNLRATFVARALSDGQTLEQVRERLVMRPGDGKLLEWCAAQTKGNDA